MAYQQNIPQPTDIKSKSQADILGNFQALVSFGNGYADLPVQIVAPSFAAGNDGVYTLNNAVTTKNELYVHKQTSAGTSEIPMTASILSQSVPVSNSAGWTMLPSGILLRWESFTGTGLTTVTLGAGYINFTTIYSIIVSPYSSSTSDDNFAVRLVSIDSATQFKVFFSSRTSSGTALGGAKALIIGR